MLIRVFADISVVVCSEIKWNPLEAGGIEPPSESTRPLVLHA